MVKALYTVSFLSASGEEVVSRFFSTLRAATKHAAWLRSPGIKIYRGPVGGELVAAMFRADAELLRRAVLRSVKDIS